MSEIHITAEQAKVIRESADEVVVRDPDGDVVGYIASDFTSEEIEEAKRRAASQGKTYTTGEVLAHLRSLEQE